MGNERRLFADAEWSVDEDRNKAFEAGGSGQFRVGMAEGFANGCSSVQSGIEWND